MSGHDSRGSEELARDGDALRSSQEVARSVFDVANVGMSITSPTGEISVNDAFAELLGYRKDELERRPWQQLTPAEDIPAVQEIVSALLEGKTDRVRFDKRYVKRDGSILWGDVSSVLRRDEAGLPLFFVTTVVDTTQRKRAEEALRTSEALFSGAFRVSPAGMTVTKIEDGTFVDVNDAFCAMFEWTRDEVIGRTSLSLGMLSAPDRDALILQQLESGGLRDALLRARARSGREVEILFSSRPLEVSGVPCHVTTMVDLTARRRAERALYASDERLRAAFEQAAVGIGHTTLDGRWTWVNKRLCAILGRSRDELLESTVEAVTHAEDRAGGRIARERMHEGSLEAYTAEKRLVRGDGEIVWVSHAMALVRTATGEPDYLTSVVEDITERKRAEAARASLEAQVFVAQKLEAVARLAGGVAHDFNNLLSVIISYASMAAQDLGERDPLRADLREIEAAGTRAAALTRQLLAFSRRQVLSPQVLDLNKTIHGVEALLGRLLGEGVDVAIDLDDKPVTVMADPGQMEQVIMNLAVNARDAMPRGGVITVQTSTVDLTGTEAERRGLRAGRYAVLALADTGIGMAPETQARIFEPFFTTKEEGRGTGLGLSTVYGIVKQSGGVVTVESELGRGTSFEVLLPRVDARPAEVKPTRRSLPTGHETVLVVEDEAAVRGLVERILQSGGYKVMAAASGGDALVVCEERGEQIDLLLTDLVMPHLGGRELAARLTGRFPRLKVLFMSGYDAAPDDRPVASREPVVAKPFSPETLMVRVREILDG